MTEIAEVGSLEHKMNKAVLSMNAKLKEQGFNERERSFMWGMSVSEMREFLTNVWEQTHHEQNATHVGEEESTKAEQDAQIDKLHGPGAAAALEEAIADGSVFSETHEGTPRKPVPKPTPPKK